MSDFGGPLQVGDDCDIDGCQYVYDEVQELFFHGYEHYGIDGLDEFARRHKAHIMKPYDMSTYELRGCPCRSFNFPLQPNINITNDMIEGYLLKILNTLGTSFKARVGVSRILMSRAPTPTPVLKFYRCEHDNFSQQEVEGVIKNIRMDKANVTESGLTGLHPYLIDSWGACQRAAPQIVQDIEEHMINDRPESDYMMVAPTNIRIYCFLVDLPVGKRQYIQANRPYIQDVNPHNDNLCLFRCIVKKHRPLENEEDRELRVQLMWRIFKASNFLEVKSDSVIKDHRQVIVENDIDYLLNDIVDYKDLLNQQLPADNKWAAPEIQNAIKHMSGVLLEELQRVEEIFDLHIDVFGMREVTQNDKKTGSNQKTVVTVIRLSDRPSDRSVDILIETDQNGAVGHYYLVTDTKQLLKKLICEHCGSIQKNISKYKIHVGKCVEGRVRHVYPGGFHKEPLGIREKLESVCITLPEDISYYNKFIVYDFESLFKQINKESAKTQYVNQHIPVSYALCDDTGNTKSQVSDDPKELINHFLQDLLELRKNIVLELTEEFSEVFDDLNVIMKEAKLTLEDLEGEHDPCAAINKEQHPVDYRLAQLQKTWAKQWLQRLNQIKKDLVNYIKMVPVLGYNSAHYDINLIKQKLITALMEDKKNQPPPYLTDDNQVEDHFPPEFEPQPGLKYPEYEAEARDFSEINVIKQGGSYTKLAVGHKLLFLDIYKYQSPNTSLDDFMTTYKAPVSKGVFPYEYLTSETLYSHDLPSIKHFYSQLKGKNLLGDTLDEQRKNYIEKVLRVWRDKKIKNLSEFLIHYNELDVKPFSIAINNWLKNFHLYNEDGTVNTKEGVDVLKTTIGIPGVARQLMYNSAAAHPGFKGFTLFNEQNREWDDRFRDNIVGGPSVIYSFHHKAGQTRLRDPVKGKLCRSVLGLDATALYASRIRKPLPHGPGIRYDPCESPEGSDDPGPWFQRKMACHMDSRVSMNFLIDQGDPDGPYPDLKHLYNQGRETRCGPFLVDGVSYDQQTILEYNGCWWHGCPDCHEKKPNRTPEQDREQQFRYRRTQARAKWLEEHSGFRVKQVWGCDQEAMRYVWGAHKLGSPFTSEGRKLNEKIDQTKLLNGVARGKFTGALEVDIEVPDTHYNYFEEFSPLFVTSEIKVEDLSPEQRESLPEKLKSKVQLVPGMKAEKVLIDSSLLKWYMEHGLLVTKVHCAIEFQYAPIFKDFIDTRTQKRREATLAGNTSEAALHKLIGNSAYGCTLLNKEKYVRIAYADVKNLVAHHHRKGTFLRSRMLTPRLAEVDHEHNKVQHDIPTQLGYTILQGGKLRMLQFYYDCLDYFLDREDFQLVEVDTDSQYLALSEPIDRERIDKDLSYHPLMSMVKPELIDEFKAMLYNHCKDDWEPNDYVHFFPRQCCEEHNKLDQKRPGLFKTEVWGTEITCACSKTYSVITCDPDPTHPSGFKEKISSKGIQARALKDVLKEANKSFGDLILQAQQGQPTQVTNMGFKTSDKEGIRTYKQRKNAINTRYMKRRKYANNTKPIMSTLTPYRTVCKRRRRQESAQTAQTDAPITSSKRRRLYIADSQASSAQVDQDPEEEVRRELGLDTNNLIEGSDGEEGEVLELDDGYRY